MRKEIGIGIIGIIVVGICGLVYRYSKRGIDRNKYSISNSASSNHKNIDVFRPDSFSSLEQADAYNSLLERFNNDSKELHNYIDKNYGTEVMSTDYIKILKELKIKM